jgi:ketosteroid isomerase-like protein
MVMTLRAGILLASVALFGMTHAAIAAEEADRRAVAALDTEFQAAVKRNDARTMGRMLDERYVLVLGNGQTYSRADLLKSATARQITYEQQDEDAGTQTVRVFGDTAVVTARLWLKGMKDGASLDYRLWFSDTYVRTASGWRYVFGQASLSPDKAGQAG